MVTKECLTPPDVERIDALLGSVNEQLGPLTPYKLAIAQPGDLLAAPKNAHYMGKRTFDRLTENIKRDGNLSSLPLCWKRADGRMELLSGHHRVQSAVAAGVPAILVLYTDAALSEGQRVATQLSHNAIVGQDNPAILKELWNQIDHLDWKVYTGLDDGLLETFQAVQVDRVVAERLQLESLTLLFLPAERERIEEIVKRLGAQGKPRMAAPIEAWEPFFEALLDFKEAAGIQNTTTAFFSLAQIAREWIERHEAEQRGEGDPAAAG